MARTSPRECLYEGLRRRFQARLPDLGAPMRVADHGNGHLTSIAVSMVRAGKLSQARSTRCRDGGVPASTLPWTPLPSAVVAHLPSHERIWARDHDVRDPVRVRPGAAIAVRDIPDRRAPPCVPKPYSTRSRTCTRPSGSMCAATRSPATGSSSPAATGRPPIHPSLRRTCPTPDRQHPTEILGTMAVPGASVKRL